MTFLIDAQTLKPGLILFRRADVKHRNWYCRIRVPRSDRYKTVSLKTADVQSATELAFDADADLRFRVKHGVPVFNRSFAQVAKAYAEHQKARSEAGEISHHRWEVVESTTISSAILCGAAKTAKAGVAGRCPTPPSAMRWPSSALSSASPWLSAGCQRATCSKAGSL